MDSEDIGFDENGCRLEHNCLRLQGDNLSQDGMSDNVEGTPDSPWASQNLGDNSSQISVSDDELESPGSPDSFDTDSDDSGNFDDADDASLDDSSSSVSRAEYERMASINAEAQTGIHKRGYSVAKRKEASAKSNTGAKKLSRDAILKDLQTRCNDNHNCIEGFSGQMWFQCASGTSWGKTTKIKHSSNYSGRVLVTASRAAIKGLLS